MWLMNYMWGEKMAYLLKEFFFVLVFSNIEACKLNLALF